MKEQKVILEGEYWVDVNGNRWNANDYSEDDAQEYSKYLIENDSFDNTDCIYCSTSNYCEGCSNCNDCQSCIGCDGCECCEACHELSGARHCRYDVQE